MRSVATVPGYESVPTVPSLEYVMDQIQGIIEQVRGSGASCQLLQVLNFENLAARERLLDQLWRRYFPDLSESERQAPSLFQTVAFYQRVLLELRQLAKVSPNGPRHGFSGSPFPDDWMRVAGRLGLSG